MVLRPLKLPQWASIDQPSPDTGQFNVVEPPLEKKQYGWSIEKPNRQWWNWLHRQAYVWLEWLTQQEEQSRVVLNTEIAFDTINGGMAIVYVIDTTTPANYYHGIAYIPPGTVTSTNITMINSNVLTVSVISAGGNLLVSGGSGNYLIYGQMKKIATV